jgi:ABC-type uncharacterized transport system involved in gliding motility auxiliary subunit
MERKSKAAAETSVYLVVFAAILVVVNVISYIGLHKRVDMTKNERFTLSVGSARLVGTLKTPLRVEAYVTKGLPKLDAFVRDLTDLLKLYQQKGSSKFDYTIIEAKSEEQRQAAKEAGLKDIAFAVSDSDDQASIAQGYMGLVFKYGSEKEVIPVVQPDRADGLEFWISNKIREIRDKADDIHHKIGVIAGKDEIKLSDQNLIASQGRQGGPSIKQIIDQTFPFYKLEDVDLKDGATEISKELDGLIITQPGKDYTDKELRRIDEFLMRGNKSLLVAASFANLKQGDASMKATLSAHGLEKLLEGYGVEMKKDVLIDGARAVRLAVMTQSGPQGLFYPGIVHAQHDTRYDNDDKRQLLDDGFAAFFRAPELSFPFPSTLISHTDKQPEAKFKVVARTSAKAWAETSETVDLKPGTKWKPKPSPDQKADQRAIAMVVEGTLKSAFGSGEGIDVPTASKEKSRVLVISSAQFLANPFARSGAGTDLGGQFAMMGPVGGDEQLQMISQPYAQTFLTGTILSLKNMLDWLSGDTDLIASSAKLMSDATLTYDGVTQPTFEASDDETSANKKAEEFRDARKNTQRNVERTLTLLCPLLFAGFGLIRWRMREGGRANITLD